jgi:hypothetical protein
MAQNKRNRVSRVREVEQWLQEIGANTAKIGARYWRRSSTRAMGLFYNGLERVNEMVLN